MDIRSACALVPVLLLTACSRTPAGASGADAAGHTAPTAQTARANARVAESLPLADPQDEADARRGFIAADPDLRVAGPGGTTIWDMPAYGFLEGGAPDSVNPSLWRQAKLNAHHGLFEVADGIWQLRGYDISNMTLIRGATGWIVVDPLTAKETAARAMDFARRHLGDRPVSAVIFTHSHVDHFGGVLGVIPAAEAARRQVPVVAPEGFVEEATSENVLAGTTMARRSMYQFGSRLPRGVRGHVDSGLGKGPAYGTIGVLPVTAVVTHTGQRMTLDGVEFVFQNVPQSEAPAELNFYLPRQRAFCGAEIVLHTLHNLYTLRGAKVRDALKWAGYLDEALRRFADAEVYFGSHTWPVWGRERVAALLESQRDTYKFIHDQTVRAALHGATPREIASALTLPPALARTFSSRGYYGTVEHNAKAVYQFYFGWYDGNPAHLHPLPPAESAARYVAAMGGRAAVLTKGREAFEAADYRWAAELLNHLVFAEPGDDEAREWLARTYDQLGYQAESGVWRDVYLTGAYELRHGPPERGVDLATTLDLLRHTPVPRFLDAMAVRLKAEDAEGLHLKVNLSFTDLKEDYVLEVKNSVLHHHPGRDPAADATLALTHELYLKMLTGQAGLRDTLLSDELSVAGSRLDLVRFFALFEQPRGTFAIVTP